MPSLDDCSRLELKRLARFSTPLQIAEAKARIAGEAASRENEERLLMSAAAIEAARAVKRHFERFGADDAYRKLFDDALLAARRSQHANNRWTRFQVKAERLERAARVMKRSEDARDGGRT
jgi:hypothetical protein